MNDAALLKTVKNSLMIAGHEMGPVGDHWPAIHAITRGVEEEFEQKDRDAAVVGELEFHIADLLRKMEDIAANANEDDRKVINGITDELWQRYYAILEPVDPKFAPSADDIMIPGVSEYKNMRAAISLIEGMGGRI